MAEFVEKYINPFTDYGFKKLFGEEPNKDLLLDFLNELLKEEQGVIVQLNYLKNEQLGTNELDRKAIFDTYCENIFEEDKNDPTKYRYDVKLTDIETKKVFYDKLTFIYLEMPKFNKTVEELETRFDKWLYVLRNLNRLDRIPDKLRERVFEKLFAIAEIARFTPEQVRFYEDSLKYYRDLKASLDTSFEEGLEKGREEGLEKGRQERAIEIATQLLRSGIAVEVITQATGLTRDQVTRLKENQ